MNLCILKRCCGALLCISYALIVTILVVAALISLSLLAGCASSPKVHPSQDANILQAAHTSQRIDDKAVIVEQWLRSNP